MILTGRIVLLSEDLSNKIAAGEVIERPASIVKELLENALDAGASDIVVELKRGGCEAIRITDNGCGIAPEDAALAFSRFATSKIYQFDDIYQVRSFGFRGEALPSIAAIAHVEMVTKQQGALAGVKVIAEGGNIREIAETGCPVGTSLHVTNIFGTVPVRRKFLKSEATEQGHCLDVVARLALAHPAVSFKVVANGRDILRIPVAKEPGERLALVLGADFLDQMLPIAGSRAAVNIRGFAARPALTRANARHIYPFVNQRFIRDHLINHAVLTAYRNLLDAKRYPAVVLLLDLPPHDVDVNVHPAKMEVRFREPRAVYELIVESLAGALGGIGSRSSAATGGSATLGQRPPGLFPYHARVEEALKRYTLTSAVQRETPFEEAWAGSAPVKALAGQEDSGFGEEKNYCNLRFSKLAYIGQVLNTYLIFAAADMMIVVDQHAAHERLLFEKLKSAAANADREPPAQRLLLPEVISLPPRDYAFLQDCLPLLRGCGFEIEPFGQGTVVVKSLPGFCAKGEPKGLIHDFLAEFTERGVASLAGKKEELYAFLACRGAVKAHQKLTPAEVAALCKALDEIPNIASCPHGRPVYIIETVGDLERKFKRR